MGTNISFVSFFPLFQTLDEWSFDVFALHEASSGAPVKYLGYELLNRYGMIHKFKVRHVTISSPSASFRNLRPKAVTNASLHHNILSKTF